MKANPAIFKAIFLTKEKRNFKSFQTNISDAVDVNFSLESQIQTFAFYVAANNIYQGIEALSRSEFAVIRNLNRPIHSMKFSAINGDQLEYNGSQGASGSD